MSRRQLRILASPTGPAVADWSHLVIGGERSYGEHGCMALVVTVRMSKREADRWYGREKLLYAEINNGARTEWAGRMEDLRRVPEGIGFTALGPWRAFSDLSYVARWSTTTYGDWRALTPADLPDFVDERFDLDSREPYPYTDGELRISPRKGTAQGSSILGGFGLELPSGGSRRWRTLTLRYQWYAPPEWELRIQRRDASWNVIESLASIAGTGGLAVASAAYSFVDTDRLTINIRRNAANVLYDDVDTTLTTAVRVGSATVTVGSAYNIAPGMTLRITGQRETVTVTAVTATTFTAEFGKAHLAAEIVRAGRSVSGAGVVTETIKTTVAAAIPVGVQVVTPASMAGIVVGTALAVGGESEDVVVTAKNGAASTFTADFAYEHGPDTATAPAVKTALDTAHTAGATTITPRSMEGIYPGMQLYLDVDLLGENVDVVTVSATSFTISPGLNFNHDGGAILTAYEIEEPFQTAVTFAASARTVTPGSTVNMYTTPLQAVTIGSGATAETVNITALTTSTFTATFTLPHDAGEAVTGAAFGPFAVVDQFRAKTTTSAAVYADEIARDLLATVVNVNPGQLAPGVALIQSPAGDLKNEVYEDVFHADILNKLVAVGDGTRRWEVGVNADRYVYLRPRGGRNTWYVDVDLAEIERSLESLRNAVYGVYDGDHGAVRTAAVIDTASIGRYGLLRSVGVSGDRQTSATALRDATLADLKTITPAASVNVRNVYDARGVRMARDVVRNGDTLVVMGLPAMPSAAVDRIRTFVVSEVTLGFDGALTVIPEAPLPRVDVLLARREEGL